MKLHVFFSLLNVLFNDVDCVASVMEYCSTTLSTTNSTLTGMELNPSLLGERLATNRLSYVNMASIRNGQVPHILQPAYPCQ